MNNFKLTTTTLSAMIALSAGSLTSSFAADYQDKIRNQRGMLYDNPFEPCIKKPLEEYTDSDFIKNGFLKLKTKNRSLYNEKDNQDNMHYDQWAHEGMMEYRSGFLMNTFAIEAELQAAAKLYASDTAVIPDKLLSIEQNENGINQYRSRYAHFARLNGKVRVGNAANFVLFRYGLFPVQSALIADNATSSSHGCSFEGSFINNTLNAYGYWLTGSVSKTHEGLFNPTEFIIKRNADGTSDGDNRVVLFGASYQTDHFKRAGAWLQVNAEVANAKQYQRQYFGQASYNVDLDENRSFLANMQYRHASGLDKWDSSYGGFDKTANHFNVNGLMRSNGFRVSGSYSYTIAPVDDKAIAQFIRNERSIQPGSLAHFYRYKFKLVDNIGSGSTFWTCRNISGFDLHKEKVYQGSVAYEFSRQNKPGLNLMLTHTYGKGHADSYLLNERETDAKFSYEFQSPKIKGLSVSFGAAWHKQTNQNKPHSDLYVMPGKTKEFRCNIAYEINLL
ncbi:MAG: OprD family porin [Endozoicomonadaceae bacterium]|nr:OprD family porin [Endozoicomonadaceae bacterium]MBE8232220.1 OprD family porin [Endozoicomonadaceae bacterium]